MTAATGERPPAASRGWRAAGYALLALLAYVPVLRSDRGMVAADTKTYLYLDPSRLLSRAWSMWDPNVGMGTVTHQTIGYLLPTGPYYWLLQHLQVPDWVAQRLWLGSLLLAAGLGMLFLLRTLDVRGAGAPVGALAFMLSPYVLDYAARISVILLPWAGLPWLLAFVIRGLRQGGWRYPALFALVVQLVGGNNVTSLVMAGLAPVLWIPYAVWVTREIPWRRAIGTVLRIGLLTVVASLWWIAGLWAQGKYGIDILRFTETPRTVARTSTAPEVLRGLGYWFFYGQDKIGPWIESAVDYTQRPSLILVSYAVPTLAILAAACTRWRHRLFFAGIVLVGLVVSVGAHPFDDPSPFGAVLRAFATGSTVGLALRSTNRATPLVALGLAVLLAAGVSAFARMLAERRRPVLGIAAAVLVGALVIVNLSAIWDGTFYGKNLERPESIPAYWQDAARYLDAQSHDTRVLELPGADFASYRWGNTVDPITPGLIDRPYVARELIPYGSPPSADLLNALDRRLQEGVFEPDTVAPLARIMGVGDVVLRNDLQTDRYNLVRPWQVWQHFDPAPKGLTGPKAFGTAIPGRPAFPQIDEQALAGPTNQSSPPPVAVLGVQDAVPIVRTNTADGTVLLAGDAEGLIDATAAGIVDGRHLVRYSASSAQDPAAVRRATRGGATLVLTDTNRKRARRWSTVRENLGYTEQAGERPLVQDLSDARLEVFPGAGDDAATVTEQRGVQRVVASRYGNPVTYTAEDRAVRAVDGDLSTAWRVGAFSGVRGERLLIETTKPITTDHVNVVQPITGPRDRWITRVKLRFDGGDTVTADLGDASRTPAGQTLTFPRRTFRTLELIVDGDNVGPRFDYQGLSPVGFAEVRLRDEGAATDIRADEVVRMPEDMLRAAGTASLRNPLAIVMTRERLTPVPPRTTDLELALVRSFRLPTPRAFALTGVARIAPTASDSTLDALLLPGSAVQASTSEHLAGDVRFRASSAIDGDPATAWNTPFVAPTGQWVEYRVPAPLTFDHANLQLVNDGRHSVPTRLTFSADGVTRTVDVPAVPDQPTPNGVVSVPVSFPALRGSTIRVTVDAVREVRTRDFYSAGDVVMPAGIAELGIPGLATPAVEGDAFSTGCRSDLLAIDGQPTPVAVTGTRTAATTRGPLQVAGCGPTISLGAGSHLVRAAAGRDTGIDLDRIVLGSLAGGRAGTVGVPASGGPGPQVVVKKSGHAKTTVAVRGATPGTPFWLVMGQSDNAGWRATVAGRDLGPSQLVDGYANGWLVRPTSASFDATIEWVPQRTVDVLLALSAIGVLACLVLAIWGPRRRGAVDGVVVDDGVARFALPWSAPGPRLGVRAVVAIGIVAGLLGLVLVGPWTGILLLVAGLLAASLPRARGVLLLVAAALLGLAGLYIAWHQHQVHVPPTFEWPLAFTKVRVLGWWAALLLTLGVAVDFLADARGRRARRADGDGGGDATPQA